MNSGSNACIVGPSSVPKVADSKRFQRISEFAIACFSEERYLNRAIAGRLIFESERRVPLAHFARLPMRYLRFIIRSFQNLISVVKYLWKLAKVIRPTRWDNRNPPERMRKKAKKMRCPGEAILSPRRRVRANQSNKRRFETTGDPLTGYLECHYAGPGVSYKRGHRIRTDLPDTLYNFGRRLLDGPWQTSSTDQGR